MEPHRNLGRNGLDLSGVGETYVINDGVDQSQLGEMIVALAVLADVDSNVVGRMTLVLDFESRVIDFLD